MVYYNPDDEEPVLLHEIINGYENKFMGFPGYPVSVEKEIEISQKHQGLEMLKRYIVKHRFEKKVIDLINDFSYLMYCRAKRCTAGSEAYQLYRNIHDAVQEIAGEFEYPGRD